MDLQNDEDTMMKQNLSVYIYIYTRRKDGAKAPSLLDHVGYVDVPIFDAEAQVFDPRALIL